MDLKALVSQMLAGVDQAKAQKLAERKAGKKLNGKATPAASLKPPGEKSSEKAQQNWRELIKWQDQAIVLVVTETECRGCQAKYISPTPHLMIQRWHRTYGLHFQPIEPNHTAYSRLPRRQKIVSLTTKACHACWPAVAFSDKRQLTLPIFPENQGVMVAVKDKDTGATRDFLTDLFSPGHGSGGSSLDGTIPTAPHTPAVRLPNVQPEEPVRPILRTQWLVPYTPATGAQ